MDGSTVKEEEIKEVVFDCDSNKALGPYGFSLKLFQESWDSIKTDLLKVF